MVLEDFKKMLLAGAEVMQAKEKELCELDSICGDGDHGITIARIGKSIEKYLKEENLADIKSMLDDISMLCSNANGGSAGPLWGTIYEGMADAAPEGKTEVTPGEFKAMLTSAKVEFSEISKAKIGDKTLVDALYPAITAGEGAEGDIPAILTAMAEAAHVGAEATKNMQAKFGRAKNSGAGSIGSLDPGAVSLAMVMASWAKALN